MSNGKTRAGARFPFAISRQLYCHFSRAPTDGAAAGAGPGELGVRRALLSPLMNKDRNLPKDKNDEQRPEAEISGSEPLLTRRFYRCRICPCRLQKSWTASNFAQIIYWIYLS